MIGEKFPRSWGGGWPISQKSYSKTIAKLSINEESVVNKLDDFKALHSSKGWFDRIGVAHDR